MAVAVDLATLRSALTRADALAAVRSALRDLAAGVVAAPDGLGLRTGHGELHVKGAAFTDDRPVVCKIASYFPGNSAHGLPAAGGLSLVFDARTGQCRAVLDDHGWLTDLRTGAAGALATHLLARSDADTAAVLGAGTQARHQIEALAEVRRLTRVYVWARRPAAARQCAADLHSRLGIPVTTISTVAEAAAAADILVTTTPSTTELVRAEWLHPGSHVTAMGSDFPGKQELAVDVLARADLVVADSVDSCSRAGELQHALAAGAIRRDQVVELSEVVAGTALGRTDPTQITVVDQCGLGVYDATIAHAVLTKLELMGANTP